MRRERRRELLPLAHEPHHLLLGTLALGGRFAHALAVRVEPRGAQPLAELGEPSLQRMNLPLDLPEPPSQLAHVLRHLLAAPGRPAARCVPPPPRPRPA